MPHISTHIGIAFYAKDGFPHQSAIVLSTHMRFDNTVFCGTVIETVNGLAVSWRECPKSSATFEPYLKLVGIITVANVDNQPSQILESIQRLEMKGQDVRASRDGLKEPHSNDYVHRVLLDLYNKRTISLPLNVKNDLDGYITAGLLKLLKNDGSKYNLYPIISLVEDEDPIFGRTRF
jgi:hypothetical protein